jgi:YVTN family beta-propeller protein
MSRLLLVASLAMVVVIAVGGVLVVGPKNQSNVSGPSPAESATSSALPAPQSVTPEASIKVTNPTFMASNGQDVWVLTQDGGVIRIDPTTNKADPAIELDGGAYLYNGFAVGPDAVWVTRWDPGLVYRIDLTTRAVAKIPIAFPEGVLPTADGVWVANGQDGTVTRIDPATNRVVSTITVGSASSWPTYPASAFGGIWLTLRRDRSVVRIDPSTNAVEATIDLRTLASSAAPNGCQGLFATSNAMWMTCVTSLIRIDPSTNTAVGEAKLRGVGFFAAAVEDAPWISINRLDADTNLIAHIDPATNQVDRVLSPGASFAGDGDIVVAGGSVWVVDGSNLAANRTGGKGTNNLVLRLPMSAFRS